MIKIKLPVPAKIRRLVFGEALAKPIVDDPVRSIYRDMTDAIALL